MLNCPAAKGRTSRPGSGISSRVKVSSVSRKARQTRHGVGDIGSLAGGGAAAPGRFTVFGLGTSLHVTLPYVRSKLALLATPWARRWTYTRVREAGAVVSASAGSAPPPYAPPARDVSAPDLYLPLMAALTLALLRGVAAVAAGSFTPDTLASAVSGVFSLWAVHTALLKGALWALGAAAAAPLVEVVAYAGYPAVHGAAACAVRAASDWRVVQGRLAAVGLAAMAAGGGSGGLGGCMGMWRGCWGRWMRWRFVRRRGCMGS